MPRKGVPREWPDRDRLLELAAQHGSVNRVAEVLGVPEPSLRKAIQRENLMEEFRLACVRVTVEGEEITKEELLEREVNELRRKLAAVRNDEIAEERQLRRLEEALAHTKPTVFAQPRAKGRREAPHEMALLFSDTHAYEQVSLGETLGMNEYNREVLLQRMTRLRDSVISFVQHRPYPIDTLHIWMLGDMLSGDIHDELAQTNEYPVEEATVQFALDTAEWFNDFTPHFGKIKVTGIPGNHPRRTKKPQAKHAHNNSDWTAYKLIEVYHRGNSAIQFDFPKASYATVHVANRWRVLLMHGDGIRSSMPGVPWGGVVRRITVLEQQFAKAKQPLDYVCLGHFHTANALDGVGVKTFLNGSVKGLDEFSMKQFGSGRSPSQLLLTFHRDRGICDVSYIDLEDVLPASA